MWTEVSKIDHALLSTKEKGAETSATIKERVRKAREIQRKRFSACPEFVTNSDMGPREIETFIHVEPEARETLNTSAKNLDLSARSYHKVIKISQTIADLESKERVENTHVLEALQYRPKKELFD